MPLLSFRYNTHKSQDDHCIPRTTNLMPLEKGRVPKPLMLLQPLRRWLAGIEISDRHLARMLCFLIPARCPFERTFKFGHTVLSIPPLCKLNPFYDELVVLRFRSLCYLVEVVGEDIARFC